MIPLFAGAALAAEVQVVPRWPGPLPGTVVPVEIHGSGPAPVVEVTGGRLLRLREARPGVVLALVAVEEEEARVRVEGEEGWREATIAPRWPDPAPLVLDLPESLGAARSTPLSIAVRGAEGPLWAAASEGRVEITPEGLLLVPEARQDPRVTLVGVLDAARPRAGPAWAVLPRPAYPEVTVRTEPGATVRLEVGARTYGPVRAGRDGRVRLRVTAWPGEGFAETLLLDDLGNTVHSTVPLDPDPAPAMALLVGGAVAAGAPLPPIHLGMVDPAGRPWRGRPPSCAIEEGPGRLALRRERPGSWRVVLEDVPLVPGRELAIRCTAPGTSAEARLRVPVGEGSPVLMDVRTFPEELTADLPVAQIQVLLQDGTGARLPPEGVEVVARGGRIERLPSPGRAWLGELTAERGRTEVAVDVTWRSPPAEEGPWMLRWAEGPEGRLAVRVLDRLRRPVPGCPVVLRTGGGSARVETGPDGWTIGGPPMPDAGAQVAEARVPGLLERRLVGPGLLEAAPRPGTPDLAWHGSLPVLVGRVRSVRVEVEPPEVEAGQRARIRVALLDREGGVVGDEAVAVEVRKGELGPLERLADGSVAADWTAPPAFDGTVEFLVRAGADRTALTRVRVRPRPVHHSVLLLGGVRATGVAWPGGFLGARVELRPPTLRRRVYGALGAWTWGEEAHVRDADRDADVDLEMRLQVAELGGVGRVERGLWAGWLGAGILLGAARMDVTWEGLPTVTGWSMAGPGFEVAVGGGRRVGPGEFVLEFKAISLTVSGGMVGFGGQAGGLALAGGYRLLL